MKTNCIHSLTGATLAGLLLSVLGATTARADAPDPVPSAVDTPDPGQAAAATAPDATTPTGTTQTKPDTKNVASGNWNIDTTGYLWFAGIHGNTSLLGDNIGFKMSAHDLLKKARFALLEEVDLRYKRVVFTDDLLYMALTDTKAATLPIPSAPSISGQFLVRIVVFTQKVGYRLIDNPKVKIDFLTGFRYFHFGSTVTVRPATPLFNNVYASRNWTDPMVGGRIRIPLSPKMTATLAGDVGGWGAGAQLDYQMVGALSYQIKPKLTLDAAWRYLYVDYGQKLPTQLALSGPVVAVTYALKRTD
jgi:hypothetical protein